MGALELVVSEGPEKGRVIPLTGGNLRIGSAPDCTLRLGGVAPYHADVLADAQGNWWVRDLSSGQLLLDGKPVAKGALKPGSFLRLGAVELALRERAKTGPSGTIARGATPAPKMPIQTQRFADTVRRPSTSPGLEATELEPTELDREAPEDGSLERTAVSTVLPPGSIIDGRYEVLAKLAEGGMGEVYRAQHVELGKPLAVKVMRPGAPTGVTGVAGNGQVTLSWTVPLGNGGAPITNYVIQYSAAGGTWTTASNRSPASPSTTVTNVVVSGLTNGTSYAFQVAAVNAAGTGDYSAASADYVPAAVPPAAPVLISASSYQDTQSLVTWTAVPTASNGGEAVIDYTATAVASGQATRTCSGGSTDTNCILSGLTNGVIYAVTVKARNSAGSSADSNSLSFKPSTVPASPTGVAGTSNANQQSVITWTAVPTGSNGGDTVIDYTATTSSGSRCTAAGSAATSCTLTGLTNGTSYTVTVKARNGSGSSAASAASNAFIPATVPTSPGTPTSTGQGNQSVTLTWTAPADNGGLAITDYKIEYATSAGGTWTEWAHTASTATTQVVTGLSNDTPYVFLVTALNALGLGPPSDASAFFTPSPFPSAPTNLAGDAASNQVTLTWTAPSSSGGSPLTDYVVEYATASTGPWTACSRTASTATSQVVTGLTNGTPYYFRVAAITAVGTGAYSSVSPAITPSPVPSAPTNVSGSAGSTVVTLNWQAPSSTGGSAITDYVVEYSSNGGTNWNVFNDGVSTTLQATVDGLNNGTPYLFRVAAVNEAGTGNFSTNSNAITVATTPSAPTITSGDPTNSLGQVHLVWTAPTDNGGNAIFDYLLQFSTAADFSNAVTANPSTSTLVDETFTGFLQTAGGQDYWFKVAAKNGIGTGTYSAQFGPIKVSAPSLPRDVRGGGLDQNEANLWWTAPAYTGGRTITGYSIESSVNGTNWFAAAPSTNTSAPTFAAPLNMTGNKAAGTAFSNNTAGIRFRVAVRWDVSGATYTGPMTTVFTCDVSGNTSPHDNNDSCNTSTTDATIPNGTLTLTN